MVVQAASFIEASRFGTARRFGNPSTIMVELNALA
jgi:hypothetical protein